MYSKNVTQRDKEINTTNTDMQHYAKVLAPYVVPEIIFEIILWPARAVNEGDIDFTGLNVPLSVDSVLGVVFTPYNYSYLGDIMTHLTSPGTHTHHNHTPTDIQYTL